MALNKKISRTSKPAPVPPAVAAPVKASRPRTPATKKTPAVVAATPAPAPIAAVPPARAASKPPARPKAVAAPPPINGASTPSAPVRPVTDEDIRMRAYFLSQEYRGHATDIDFWLIAERELRPRAQSRD